MKLGKKDWGFKVNIETGSIEMSIPKVESFSTENIFHVVFAASKVISSMHGILEYQMKQAEKERKNSK